MYTVSKRHELAVDQAQSLVSLAAVMLYLDCRRHATATNECRAPISSYANHIHELTPTKVYTKGLLAAHAYVRMHPESAICMIHAAPGSRSGSGIMHQWSRLCLMKTRISTR